MNFFAFIIENANLWTAGTMIVGWFSFVTYGALTGRRNPEGITATAQPEQPLWLVS